MPLPTPYHAGTSAGGIVADGLEHETVGIQPEGRVVLAELRERARPVDDLGSKIPTAVAPPLPE
jgi:hypothetical protein